MANSYRPAWLEIDLDAIRQNVTWLKRRAGSAELYAVVKANGYGHGAVPVAKAALQAGADGLCIALVEEAVELRDAGIGASILMLSEPPVAAAEAVVETRMAAAVYTEEAVMALATAAQRQRTHVPLHLKVDTGMNRVGCAPTEAKRLIDLIADTGGVTLSGMFTHFASADDDPELTAEQYRRFAEATAHAPVGTRLHCDNSAGLLNGAPPLGLVRTGIAMYGLRHVENTPLDEGLRPALSLRAEVSYAKDLPAGSRVSYGQRHQLEGDARVLTVPVGYADGVPRNLGLAGAEALVNGRRCRVAGQVTMDQLLLDAGDDTTAVRGSAVTLIGRQGEDEITAHDWAALIGTISYEVTCRFGQRLPRRYVAETAE